MERKIKRVIFCLLFFILFVFCGKFFRYILIDDTASYTRITFHEMYEQDNIDVLFVGSSHCYRAFVPRILDEELGMNTFNVGTSSQNLDGSYMVIQEAARYNDIKHIYLELYYNVAFSPAYKSRTEMTQTYIISDYLRPSVDKVQYLLKASTNDYYFNSFILARRNWTKFFDADYIKDLVIKKSSDDYKNYEYTYITGDTEWYAGKGYVANNVEIKDWNYFSNSGWNNINLNGISEDWFNTLSDIISFCDKKGISLTFVTVPISNFMLVGTENYDDYVAMIRGLIADTEVEYFDFNLCKEEFFPNVSTLFKDADHVNCYGAELFSHLFADFVSGRILEDDLFYNSFEEKIKNLKPTVFGISYDDNSSDNEKATRNCKIVSNSEYLEYKIMLAPVGRDSYVLQEFSDNKFFTIATDDHGICTIEYRLNSLLDDIRTVKISY